MFFVRHTQVDRAGLSIAAPRDLLYGGIIERFTGTYSTTYAYLGDSDWLLKETKYPFGSAAFDLVQYRYISPKLMRIALRDGGACNSVIYLQMNWHGDFYRLYSANGDSFLVQLGDEWGNWPSGPLACGAQPAYHWNAQWGALFFADLGAPNGTNPPLGLYYVHGRWYNPEVGLFLSPDEHGDYFYGGDLQDPVNYAQVQTAQEGFSREEIINFASVERQLIDLSMVPPFDFSPFATASASVLAAYEAIGEVGNMCKSNSSVRVCRLAFGAIALAIQNRYDYCQGRPQCPFSKYGLPSHPTRSEIIVADCAQGLCRQFEGLEHWIRIESGSQAGKCNVINPSDCYYLGQPGRQRQFDLAFDAAFTVFSGRYKTDRDLSPFLDQDVGRRVNFGGLCGGTMPSTPMPGSAPRTGPTLTPAPTSTPGPTQCNWVSYADHFFWGP